MRLALITPYSLPSPCGNSITAHRIESGLRDRGLEVGVFSLERQEAGAIRREVGRLCPDVVHGLHAARTGRLVVEAAEALGVASLITFTGTDVNEDLFDPGRRPLVLDVVRRAEALVAFHASIKAKVIAALPQVADRVHVISQAVRCQEVPADLGEPPAAAFVAFQAAGIRRVKNIPSVLPPLSAVHERHPRLRYLLAGPIIEPEESERVEALLRDRPWATYLGALPHGQVCGILSGAHVVINSSLSEGGMSNAVLEAMSQAVPVLASDIEGNRSVIEDGRDGFLYRSAADFEEKLERLMMDPLLRRSLGRRAQEKMARHFRPEAEIDAYVRLYRSLTAARV